jgi:hypothetical protein
VDYLNKAASEFWKWFLSNEDYVYNYEKDIEKVFDRLHERLRKVHPDLVFEFSTEIDGKREFTISAGGLEDAFPAVLELINTAPKLPRWNLIAFRKRQDPVLGVQLGTKKFEPEDITFSSDQQEGRLNLFVYMKGVEKASKKSYEQLLTAMFLLLDATLGEFDVTTKLAGIELCDAKYHHDLPVYPLIKLREVVDALPAAKN